MPYSILLCEDDKDFSALLKFALEKAEYDVECVDNGIDAITTVTNKKIHCVIMDINLEAKYGTVDGFRKTYNGFEAIKKIRENYSNIPIIVITGAYISSSDEEKAYTLDCDKYFRKGDNFDVDVMIGAIKQTIEKYRSLTTTPRLNEGVYQAGKLLLDTNTRIVTVNGAKKDITTKEYELLEYLIKNKPNYRTYDQIVNAIWGYDYNGGNEKNSIQNLASKLQKKLGINILIPHRGVGYSVEDNIEEAVNYIEE